MYPEDNTRFLGIILKQVIKPDLQWGSVGFNCQGSNRRCVSGTKNNSQCAGLLLSVLVFVLQGFE
jgi:hypothetical protein